MIAYLGPEGTFSHMAAQQYADIRGKADKLRAYDNIYSLIAAVDSGEAEMCIAPIENSIEGSINVTLDALAYDFNLYICDEHILPIRQNFMVKKGFKKEDVRLILSHSSALGQCDKMLKNNFPNAEIKSVSSTALAAKTAAESDGGTAAICSKNCASLYGLNILYPDCNDEDTNSTRFVILSKKQNFNVTEHDKSSVVFALDHKPGTLYRALALFDDANINMLKIESRPLKTELGKYIFFIDIEGNIDNSSIYFALDLVKRNTLFYKFLGSYPCRS
jgi:prephenate dehydratase